MPGGLWTNHYCKLNCFLIKFVFINSINFFILYGKSIWADTMIIDDMKNSTMNGEAEKADFCEENSKRWCFVSDKVMGGVSEGSLELIKNEEQEIIGESF